MKYSPSIFFIFIFVILQSYYTANSEDSSVSDKKVIVAYVTSWSRMFNLGGMGMYWEYNGDNQNGELRKTVFKTLNE